MEYQNKHTRLINFNIYYRRLTVMLMTVCMVLFSTVGAANVVAPAIGSDPNDMGTTEEKGIMATLVLMYTKSRNAVKYAYDEIQYWKGMHRAYKRMEDWFERNMENLDNIAQTAKEVFTKGESPWDKILRAESLFDQMDNVMFRETREFDKILTSIENKWDDYGNHHERPDRVRRRPPQVAEILSKIDRFYVSTDTTNEMIKDTRAMVPQTALFDATKLQVAASIAQSEYYYAWSLNAMENLDSLQEKFKNHRSIPQIETQTAWYKIENAHAKNVRIRHSVEELKLYIANLGLDVHHTSQRRAEALAAFQAQREIGMEMARLRR